MSAQGEGAMWRWAAFFLSIVVVAGILGFEGFPAPWAEIAKTIALIAFVLFLASVIVAVVMRRRPPLG
jgi:uncharacterized membrane protein YtjA (UPF0391 family)